VLTMLLNSSALAISAVLAIPSAVFAVECIAGTLIGARQVTRQPGRRPAIAILVPAHNEEAGLARTLQSLRAEMLSDDRLVVVADNCTDNTASLARSGGAEVVERFDEANRGKGFALHAGMLHLAANPPGMVVIVDADCTLAPGSLDQLAGMVTATNGPVQACYLMTSPAGSRLDMAVREFAFVVKNRVRPLGLANLGLPCQLTGSGMAFPWSVISSVDLSNDNLVEDMKLGLDLARAGNAPSYCADAKVSSEFPLSRSGAMTQKSRWENGHIAMIKTALRTLMRPDTLTNPRLMAMALDIMVPPLALLVLLLMASLAYSALLFFTGVSTAALVISLLSLLLVTIGIVAAWFSEGSRILPAGKLYRIPLYALRKVAFYAGILRGKPRDGWIRTDRSRGE
jgi:cellulose synthase/poly-beta-1,6-N-acetylglucosamine synthase-like glycosyltransferase